MGGISHDLIIKTRNARQANISTEEALENKQLLIILRSRKSYLFEDISPSLVKISINPELDIRWRLLACPSRAVRTRPYGACRPRISNHILYEIAYCTYVG